MNFHVFFPNKVRLSKQEMENMDFEKQPLWKMALLASPESFGAMPANFEPGKFIARKAEDINKFVQNNAKTEKLTFYYIAVKEQICVDSYFLESLATAYFRISENYGEKIFLQGNAFLAKLAKAIFEKDENLFETTCKTYKDDSYFSECNKILKKTGFIPEPNLYEAVLLLTEEYLSTKCELPTLRVIECAENSENASELNIIFAPQGTSEEQLGMAEQRPLDVVGCSSDFLVIGLDFFDFLSKNFPCQNNEHELAIFMREIYDEDVCENLRWFYEAIITESLSKADFTPSIKPGIMPANKFGAYSSKDKAIYINHRLALDSLRNPKAAFLLLLAMLHEYGHFLDDVLHEKAGINGDSEDEEGKIFANRFLEYSASNLLNADFKFTDFIAPDVKGEDQRFDIGISGLSYEQRKEIECIFEFSEDLDQGRLELPDGEKIENVEYFGLVNATNAISKTHQNLTIAGARAENINHDVFMTDGSIWPDFPTERYLETNIPSTLITLARGKSIEGNQIIYESHYGKNQYWHSMCPKLEEGVPTNAKVVEAILKQAERWYMEAVAKKNENKRESFFAIGKLCHIVQDSFVLAHCWRRYVGDEDFISLRKIEEEDHGKIWSFQDYAKQDGGLHAYADAPVQENEIVTIGYESAKKASEEIMKRYNRGLRWYDRYSAISSPKDYISEIYKLCEGRADEISGGTHPWFSKDCKMSPKNLKERLSNFSFKVKEF